MSTISTVEPTSQSTLDRVRKVLPISGSSTHVVLEFPFEEGFIYLGSLVSISYSTYTDKSPVFVCGSNVIKGFAIGNRWVAGSMIINTCLEDEISSFLQSKIQQLHKTNKKVLSVQESLGTYAKDSLVSFNISIIFTTEFHPDSAVIRLNGATFVNIGQVMSIEDLVTETSLSFVARTLEEQKIAGGGSISFTASPSVVTGTRLLQQNKERRR